MTQALSIAALPEATRLISRQGLLDQNEPESCAQPCNPCGLLLQSKVGLILPSAADRVEHRLVRREWR